MPDIPIDLIEDILSRLPVKSLLRFRCISKPICALLDDRHFIKLHFNRSIKTKSNLNLMLAALNRLYSVSCDSLDVAIELDPPFNAFKEPGIDNLILRFCDGLICLATRYGNAAIWNPATRKYCKLPVVPTEFPGINEIVFDIGYDLFADDYKVVRVVNFSSQHLDSEVWVFSLRSNSWKRTKDFPSNFRVGTRRSVPSCGVLHWKLDRGKTISPGCNEFIVAFDLATEEHGFLPTPEFLGSPEGWFLGKFEGCICICLNYRAVCLDLWVMKEYGVKDSWSLLFTVSNTYPELSFDVVFPLMYSKSGRKVLMKYELENHTINEIFVWYDPEQDTMEDIDIDGLPEYFCTDIYVESLVPVCWGGENDGKKQHGKKQHKQEQKKNAKKR